MSVPEVIGFYLSYQDAAISKADKEQAYYSTVQNPTAIRYAEALGQVLDRHGRDAVLDAIRHMTIECALVLEAVGVPKSPYRDSIGWAAWDIAKQSYFVTHPDEIQSGYNPQDPMTSREQRKEIVDRHIGWEFHRAYQAGSIDMCIVEMQVPAQNIPLIYDLLRAPPKPENGTLKSNQLAELGRLLHTELADQAAIDIRVV